MPNSKRIAIKGTEHISLPGSRAIGTDLYIAKTPSGLSFQ